MLIMFFETFEILFGWRKASTCKKLIRHLQCRLMLLKNKRESIIKQLHRVIVQLIKNGHDHGAFRRVEQLIRDQNTKDVYDLLDNFGELIILRLPYIRRHRDCPNDISEAASSLLFASARVGDLPELIKLRKLFRKRYGTKFVNTAVELLSGNQVNQQMIEKLNMKSLSDDAKFRFLTELARESNLQLRPHYIVQPGFYDIDPLSCDLAQKSFDRVDDYGSYGQSNLESCISRGSLIQNADNVTGEATFCSPSYPATRSIEHLDDVYEFQTIVEDGRGGDVRGFTFKLTTGAIRFKSETSRDNPSGSSPVSHDEEDRFDGITSSKKARNRKKTVRNRLGGYVSVDDQECSTSLSLTSCMDTERAVYYGEAGDSLPDRDLMVSHRTHPRKYQENMSLGKDQITTHNNYPWKVPRELDCSNDIKYYICSEDKIDDWGTNGECIRYGTSSSGSCSTAMVPWARTDAELSSLNSTALIVSRPENLPVDNQSSSCSHVHPNLPDYDNIVSKFMALKIEHQQINSGGTCTLAIG